MTPYLLTQRLKLSDASIKESLKSVNTETNAKSYAKNTTDVGYPMDSTGQDFQP